MNYKQSKKLAVAVKSSETNSASPLVEKKLTILYNLLERIQHVRNR
mgnify:CR=1 FL=1